jgi:hypothetical protein
MIRWTAFSDRAAARSSLDKLLAYPFDRLIVGHGMPLTAGGRKALARPTPGCCRRIAKVSVPRSRKQANKIRKEEYHDSICTKH